MTSPKIYRAASVLSCFPIATFVVLCACMLLACGSANAQVSGQATLSGTVTDAANAVIVGAHVTVTDAATNVSINTDTNSTGYFEVDHLNPGTYKILIASTGFEDLLRQGITLDADAKVNVPLQLHPGRAMATVTVNADALLLNTESASEGQVLSTRQVESLTVSGSNPTWLELIAPGVQAQISQIYSTGDGGGLIWQGMTQNFGNFGRIGRNEFNLDGAPNASNGEAEAINLPADAVGEMKMDVTGYDASIGHTLGVNVTQTTKGGTNDLHGAVRETYQDTRWQSLTGFQGRSYRYSQFQDGCTNGATTNATCYALENKSGNAGTNANNGDAAIGGPVYIPHVVNGRNKLFFFFTGTIDNFAGSGAATATIPTLQEETGNFSDWANTTALPSSVLNNPPAGFIAGSTSSAGVVGTCPTGTPFYGQYQLYNPFSVVIDGSGKPRRTPFCGNQIPAGLLANSAMTNFYNNLITETPPNQINFGGGNYNYASLTPQTLRDYTTREDLKLGQKDSVYVRYNWQRYTKQTINAVFDNLSHEQEARWIQVPSIGWNHIFSDRTNLSVSYGGSNYKNTCCYYPADDKYNPSSLGLPGYANTYAQSIPRDYELPILGISSYQGVGTTDNPINTTRDFALSGDITHIVGRHTIHAGATWRTQNNAQGPTGNVSGTYNFDDTYTQENNGSDSSFPANNFALSYAAFLMGVNTSQSVSHNTSYSFQSPYYGFYVGDTWRVTPKFTIIPGIRFELEDGLVEKHNQMIVGWNPTASLPLISGPANTAYAATLAAATPAELAVLPTSLTIQGGPLYAGVNGNPRNGYVNSWRVLPRFGAAYQVSNRAVIRAGFGLYFDTLYALSPDDDQDGFSASTSQSSSTNFGTSFAAPLSNPFPANSSGANFNAPVGSAAGSYYYLGASPSNLWDHNLVPPREYRGSIGVQYQFGESTMLDVSWNISRTTDIGLSKSSTFTPSSFYSSAQQPNSATSALLGLTIPVNPFALANFSGVATANPAAYTIMSHASQYTASTVSMGTLVRAYPQMGGFTEHEFNGLSNFDELLFSLSHRYSHGLTVNGSFEVNQQHDADYYANAYDPSPSWEPSNASLPTRLTVSEVWALPFGRGNKWATSGIANALAGGFQINTSYEAQPGVLVGFGNLFYIGTPSAKYIKLQHPTFNMNNLYTNGTANTITWLYPGDVTATAVTTGGITTCTYSNGVGFVTNASCQPNSYNTRIFPTRIPGVRQMGNNSLNGNITRNFHLAERFNLETSLEVFNVFNHQIYGAPTTTTTSSNFGLVTGGGSSRWLELQGRLRF
jgi:hypothetical protein